MGMALEILKWLVLLSSIVNIAEGLYRIVTKEDEVLPYDESAFSHIVVGIIALVLAMAVFAGW